MREQKSQFRVEDIQDLIGYVVIVTGGEIGLHTRFLYQD
jgi:hypothetical protein